MPALASAYDERNQLEFRFRLAQDPRQIAVASAPKPSE